MAREFPRFLFSKRTRVKHPGAWIVHTLHPQFIAKAYLDFDEVPQVDLLQVFSPLVPATDRTVTDAFDAMKKWFNAQLLSGDIQI
jgi:hypothetical protein